MTTRRSIGNLLAIVGLFVASLSPDSTLKDGLRYLAMAYISLDLCLRAHAGYLRRRSHWTRESWRRYFIACLIPAAALLVLVCMMVALEWRLPIVGAARSTTRSIWAVGTLVFLLIGAGGLVTAIEWLDRGDPSRQFDWPRWLTRGPGSAA